MTHLKANYNTTFMFCLSRSTALATIGSLLIRKVYSSDDSNMPLLYLRKAVSLNNIEAEWELAQVELREGRLDAALQHLQRAERGGHVRATMALAQLYDNGLGGLKQSCKQAALLYKKVCEIGPWVDEFQGPREAVKEFRKGKESSALTLSLLAAMEGHEVAQFNAAWMLLRNKGMEESNISFSPKMKDNMRIRYETAAGLLNDLTLQQPMNAESNILLGDIYMGGYIVPHNLNSSALHYERAADAGNALGMERLALLLINGRGVPQRDHKRAVQLMTHALSHISSGQSKIGGVQALLKQLVLTYRIVFLRLCDIVKERLNLDFIQRGIRRIQERVNYLNRDAHYSSSSSAGSTVAGGGGSSAGGLDSNAKDSDAADNFVRSTISFQSIRYSGEEVEKTKSDEVESANINQHEGMIGKKMDRVGGISLSRSNKEAVFLKSGGSGQESGRGNGKGDRNDDDRERSKRQDDAGNSGQGASTYVSDARNEVEGKKGKKKRRSVFASK